MKWMKIGQRPTEPGSYWVEEPDHENVVVWIVWDSYFDKFKVYAPGASPGLAFLCAIHFDLCRFAGPIPEPEEPK